MNTIALRFAENFAPEEGTIKAHEKLINENGFVWYGKRGASLSKDAESMILSAEDSKILLIQSGKTLRYWAHICEIQKEKPPKEHIPEDYRNRAEKFGTWFRVTLFEPAPKDILSKCKVTSSGTILSIASRQSMSPYFKITYCEEED